VAKADERTRPGHRRRPRCALENKRQIGRRLSPDFVHLTLDDFHKGLIDSAEACLRLDIGRAHLFRLRLRRIHQKPATAVSGGNHRSPWPADVQRFLEAFLPLQRPPNFQLLADELASRFAFRRDRKAVASHVRAHFPGLIQSPAPIAKPRRRWQRARIGELWQHDSSIHPWWEADSKQTLLPTVDDHSRRYVAATFVPSDTTWAHFEHFRGAFLRHGCPQAVYTDGLSLFGHQSTGDGRDPRSEFQRALTALGMNHLVAPSPQAKGKIERRFGTFQKRMLALLAYEEVCGYDDAQAVLEQEVDRQNRTVCRTTGLSPNDAWDKALEEKRSVISPCPDPCLLDLHLAFHLPRRRNADNQVDFDGRSWPIAPTLRTSVTIIHHPGRQFWVVSAPPKPTDNRWPAILAKHSL
jgi:hypothetical protein